MAYHIVYDTKDEQRTKIVEGEDKLILTLLKFKLDGYTLLKVINKSKL